MREGLISLLAFLFDLGLLNRSFHLGTFAGLDSPLLDGQTSLGSAGFKGDFIILDGQDTAGEACRLARS